MELGHSRLRRSIVIKGGVHEAQRGHDQVGRGDLVGDLEPVGDDPEGVLKDDALVALNGFERSFRRQGVAHTTSGNQRHLIRVRPAGHRADGEPALSSEGAPPTERGPAE